MYGQEPLVDRTRLDRIETWVSGISIGLAAVLVVIAVVLRYLFAYSHSALDEITRYLVVWGTLIASSRLLRRNGHITIDILAVHLSPRPKAALRCLALLLGAVFCALLVWKGTMLCLQSYQLGAFSMSALRIPMWIPQAAVPVGAALMGWRFLQLLLGEWARLRALDAGAGGD